MISTIIGIIVTLIIVGVIYWGITQLLPLIPLPEPIARIINVLLVILLVIIVVWAILALLGPLTGAHMPGWFRAGVLLPIAGASAATAAHLH